MLTEPGGLAVFERELIRAHGRRPRTCQSPRHEDEAAAENDTATPWQPWGGQLPAFRGGVSMVSTPCRLTNAPQTTPILPSVPPYNHPGTGNPFSRRNGTLNNFDAYRAPPSHKIVTTVWPGPSRLATRIAAAMLIPALVPTDRPS